MLSRCYSVATTCRTVSAKPLCLEFARKAQFWSMLIYVRVERHEKMKGVDISESEQQDQSRDMRADKLFRLRQGRQGELAAAALLVPPIWPNANETPISCCLHYRRAVVLKEALQHLRVCAIPPRQVINCWRLSQPHPPAG